MSHQIIGLIGISLSFLLFFFLLFIKEKINGPFSLLFPVSLMICYFFIGITLEGTINGGLKQVLMFLLLLAFAMIFGLLLRHLDIRHK